jgi:hypothetical protein
MIYLIVGIAIFIAGMCVGAAFMFIYMTWAPVSQDDPEPRRRWADMSNREIDDYNDRYRKRIRDDA